MTEGPPRILEEPEITEEITESDSERRARAIRLLEEQEECTAGTLSNTLDLRSRDKAAKILDELVSDGLAKVTTRDNITYYSASEQKPVYNPTRDEKVAASRRQKSYELREEIEEEILDFIGDEPLSHRQIAGELSHAPEIVKVELERLVEKNLVTPVEIIKKRKTLRLYRKS